MISQFLERVIQDDALHGRWLNTLSYLEYVGARKIIKSQHEDNLDAAVLEHIAEELHHAHFLKKLIRRWFHRQATTYAADAMLAKSAAKNYIQSIDALCARFAHDARHAYILTSYVIETRALALYTTYDTLMATEKSFRLKSILKQEERHLAEMEAALILRSSSFASWKDELCRREQDLFQAFLNLLLEDIDKYENTAQKLSPLHPYQDGTSAH